MIAGPCPRVKVGMVDAQLPSMETLSHTRESASSFIHQAAPQLRSPHQGSPDFFGWGTPAWDAARDAIFRIVYVARDQVIRWCLALANYIQRAQAKALARRMSTKGGGLPAGVSLPPPSFPSPSRRYSPPPKAPSASAVSLAPSSSRELRYEDFDDAPTGVYHPVPTEMTTQKGRMQSDARILSE